MTIRKLSMTAKTSSPRRLMMCSFDRLKPVLPGQARRPVLRAENGEIRRIQFDGHAGAKRFALALADRQIPLAGFFDELPTVEAGALRLAVVKGAHLFAEAVIPILAVELEIVGGVLALVHLREVVFGDAQVLERELAPVEFAAHAQRHGLQFLGE